VFAKRVERRFQRSRSGENDNFRIGINAADFSDHLHAGNSRHKEIDYSDGAVRPVHKLGSL
jgi:hypothetical protein